MQSSQSYINRNIVFIPMEFHTADAHKSLTDPNNIAGGSERRKDVQQPRQDGKEENSAEFQ